MKSTYYLGQKIRYSKKGFMYSGISYPFCFTPDTGPEVYFHTIKEAANYIEEKYGNTIRINR